MPRYRLKTWYIERGSGDIIEAPTPQEAVKLIEPWMVECDEFYAAELHVADIDDHYADEDELVAQLRQGGGEWNFDPNSGE